MRKVTLSALAIALAMGLSACSSSQEESYDPSSNNVSTFQPNKSSSENIRQTNLHQKMIQQIKQTNQITKTNQPNLT